MEWLILILIVIGFGLIVSLVFKISSQLASNLNAINQQLNDRLKDQTDTLFKAQQDLTTRLSKISEVEKTLAKMEQTYKEVLEVSKDISSLQDLLRAPKFRGGMGEFLLENLLSQILPSQHYSLQYSFRNGTKADAVIRIGENLVAVDAKFPLESFKRLIESHTDEEKKVNRKQFVRDVQDRIDEIAQKYILPDEGTYDFALMYIPAENVYYEAILRDMDHSNEKNIYSYALSKKVIPVSPHSFYPYLMVILRGLKGLAIQKDARKVMEYLSGLQVDLNKFREDFRLLGTHISNAKTKFEDAERKLERFGEKFLASSEKKKIEEKNNSL